MTINREDLHTLDLSDIDSGECIPRPVPGDTLRLDFMEPLGLSAYALAKAMGVPANRVTGIMHGARTITADTALRLARYFGTTPQFWMNLQTAYDLAAAQARMTAA